VNESSPIDIAFLPTEVCPAELAVVVDVLRASTTIVSALAGGFPRVLCVEDVDHAEQLRGPGRALAGERECKPIPGFDYGNSPGELEAGEGRELVLTTTNGCPAILAAAAQADKVVVGALVNLDALVDVIARADSVIVVCSGTHGRVALEDLYAAGRIVARVQGRRTDAALAVERLAGAYQDTYQPLDESADAAVLKETGQEADIAFCARESVFDLVPHVDSVSEGVATISELEGMEGSGSADHRHSADPAVPMRS